MTVQRNLEQFALKKGRNVSGKEMSEPPRSFSRKKNLRGKQGLLISRGGFNGWICWPGRKAVFPLSEGQMTRNNTWLRLCQPVNFPFFLVNMRGSAQIPLFHE